MKIAVGSMNPAKISAVEAAFQEYTHELIAVDAESGVRAQPMTDNETIQGAVNRAIEAAEKGSAAIGIGLEGGVQQTSFGLVLTNWGALVAEGIDPIIAGGARIVLPKDVADKILSGEELGPVMDQYARKQNVRKNEGAVGIFTNGFVNRSEMFTHVMKLLVGQYVYQLGKKDGKS